mmetsp:Transcript_20668/g.22129  ORF Transcript_20668/g.22129 Transcript_20668/m.22129 type:complete len:147 (+) Transcript_20668:94-534(+)
MNLKDMIMLETVALMAFASTASTSASTASATPPSATKSEEKPRPRPRPHRKKIDGKKENESCHAGRTRSDHDESIIQIRTRILYAAWTVLLCVTFISNADGDDDDKNASDDDTSDDDDDDDDDNTVVSYLVHKCPLGGQSHYSVYR